MSCIMIRDLSHSKQMDERSMSKIVGGNSWLDGLGPAANVKVDVTQNIAQFQNVQVNALNNVGVIGAGFGPLRLNVSPTQGAATAVGL
jgi:hypothetical protein